MEAPVDAVTPLVTQKGEKERDHLTRQSVQQQYTVDASWAADDAGCIIILSCMNKMCNDAERRALSKRGRIISAAGWQEKQMRGAYWKAARGKTRTENSGWGDSSFFLLLSLFLIRLLHLATVSSRATATAAGTPDDVRSPGLYWLISAAISVFALPPFHFLFLFLVLTSFHVLIRTRRRERSAVWNYYGMELELL